MTKEIVYVMVKVSILIPFPKCAVDIKYIITDGNSTLKIKRKMEEIDDVSKININDIHTYVIRNYYVFDDRNLRVKKLSTTKSTMNEVQESLSTVLFRLQDASRQTVFSMLFDHIIFYRLDVEYEENNTDNNKLLDTELNSNE